MNEGEIIKEHKKYLNSIRELKSSGAKMEEEDVVCRLLITTDVFANNWASLVFLPIADS